MGSLSLDESPAGGEQARCRTAWPNVTDAFTQISLSQAMGRSSMVDIHDLRGRRVRRLDIPARGIQAEWDGRNDRGQHVSSGMYFARVRGARAGAAKIVVVK